VDLARQLAPDVIVMDISMPVLNGIEATRVIHQENPGVKVIGLSMHSSKRYIREMHDAGASGYLLKDCDFDELIEAIRTVAQGGTYFDPRITTGTP
jgi:DNA-binding NarL/FixJ family response regulator